MAPIALLNGCELQPPSLQVYGLTVAFVVGCAIPLAAVGAAVFALSRAKVPAVVHLAIAAAIAAAPFALFPRVDAWLGAALARDAQLGFFCGATAFAFAAFRVVEVAWGTTPSGAATSLESWLLYFNASPDPRYAEGKPIAAPPNALRQRLLRVPGRLLAMGALCSVLEPNGKSVFHRLAAPPALPPSAYLLATNVLYSILLWLFLAFCFDMGSCAVVAQGVDSLQAFSNPVFGATSPKDFWGKRWNRQVNALLRRSVFQPLAGVAGATAAALGTFAASAAFHEFQFRITFGSEYALGGACRFFACNVGLCVAQTALEKLVLRRSLALQGALALVPRTLKVAANILAMAPFGHLFVDLWIRHGMLDTISRMVPTVRC